MKESGGITPLRTILRNCLNHIENLETNRSISDNYDKEFQDLKQFSDTLKVQKEFSCTEGEKEVNRKKNRYKDILPFNGSRVVLNEYAGIPGSDYINANFIKGASGSPAYIASQGPLPNTVNDFWRMVVECEVQVIVMACNAQESGKHKCENYWVEKEGEEKRFGMVQICLVKASTVCPDFLVRTMKLKYVNDKDVTEERTVCQFHYSAWPDHGVPPLVRPLLDMVRLVRDTQASETLPVLVHCSAGCGRTGTICAIDFVWGLLRAGKLTEEFSLFNLVRDMRKQRVAMVQTKEQYILVHQAVRELFKEQLRVIESHPYENIDFNGVPLIKDFEEPFYDTIHVHKENCDEKRDKNEVKEKVDDVDTKGCKGDSAPPLPRKKRPNVLFSKQEKEAENITEKNRLFVEKEKADAPLSSLLGKPRIVKLRALFEKSPTTKERSTLKDRSSQTVSRSHSLGASGKPLVTDIFESQVEKNKTSSPGSQPSDVGKLKHSKSFSKSVPLIKRSKSLKSFNTFHLSVTSSDVNDKQPIQTYPTNHHENETPSTINDSTHSRKKLSNVNHPELVKECSVRRRSLESLMGDLPPSITWPTSVKKDVSDVKSKQDWAQKLNSQIYQGTNTSELIKHQFQRLSLETEKKINNLASGIGIRERRNSFRQAVSKSDFGNISRNHNHPQPSSSKQSDRNDYVTVLYSKPVKNAKEKYKMLVSSAAISDTSSQGSKVVRGSKLSESLATSKMNSNGGFTGPQMVLSVPKINNSCDDLERNLDSKNLFLKKLNSEILLEREQRDVGNSLKQSESRFGPGFEDLEFENSRFTQNQISGHSDEKKLMRMNIKLPGPNKKEIFDEPDGPKSRPIRTSELESNEKVFHTPRSNAKIGHQIYVKPQKFSSSLDSFKNYSNTVAQKPVLHNKVTVQRKARPYSNPILDTSANSRREDKTHQDNRNIDKHFLASNKANVCCAVPMKVPSVREHEDVVMSSYSRNLPGKEIYSLPNSDLGNIDKKLVLPKTTAGEKSCKGFDCLPWPHSSSSGEASSSDQLSYQSDSSRLMIHYESDSSPKYNAKIIKGEQAKASSVLLNESAAAVQDREKRDSNSHSRVDLNMNSSFNIPASKSRQQVFKYSKDDFLLEEPTAPPRVKRHASVTIPRNNINSVNHISNRVPSEKNLNVHRPDRERNTTLEADKNAWSGSFGVDLDAVAASMQQDKKESSVLNNGGWYTKSYFNASGNINTKKKQHYF